MNAEDREGVDQNYTLFERGVPEAQEAAKLQNKNILAKVPGWRGSFDYYEIRPDGTAIQHT